MNPHLSNFKERNLVYKFRIKHCPGKLNATLNCSSRYPVGNRSESTREDDSASGALAQQDEIDKPFETIMVYSAQTIDSAVKEAFTPMYESDPRLKAITWERIVAAAAIDEKCRTLTDFVQNVFPKLRNDLPSIARFFWPMPVEIYYLKEVPIKSNKILIP